MRNSVANIKTKGTALITALFIMTLVAIAATAMSIRLQIEIKRTRLSFHADTAMLASQLVDFWATGVLKAPKIKALQKGAVRVDRLPAIFPNKKLIYPGAQIQARLEDMQSKFNINNLMNRKAQIQFIKLVQAAIPNTDFAKAKAISQAIVDWISPYRPGQGYTAYQSYYSKASPPYQQSHQILRSITELRLIQGIDPKVYTSLLPYVTALPSATPINLNTASLPVIQTLGPGLSAQQAKMIIDARGKKGFNSIQDLQKIEAFKRLEIPQEQYTLVSEYFLVRSEVRVETLKFQYFTRLIRQVTKKKINVGLLSKSINTL